MKIISEREYYKIVKGERRLMKEIHVATDIPNGVLDLDDEKLKEYDIVIMDIE